MAKGTGVQGAHSSAGGLGSVWTPPDALHLECLEPVRAGQAAEKIRFLGCMQLTCRTWKISNSSILPVSQSCFKILCMERWGLGTSPASQWELPHGFARGASGQQGVRPFHQAEAQQNQAMGELCSSSSLPEQNLQGQLAIV